ncbi:hypothetical protein [Longibaculum muris]|uniref:hypothetical protein n=1 Tax=Longibaculum muris TaxID=1796628 RepID=UPI0029437391|nr:hypothetical protein [Longibaculum muris]
MNIKNKNFIKTFYNFLKSLFNAKIILLFLFVVISPMFVNILVETKNPFGLGFIDDSNKDAWIGFFGAIIGGALTIFGVLITINDQRKNNIQQQKEYEKQRREDLAIQYQPWLIMNFTKNFKTDDYILNKEKSSTQTQPSFSNGTYAFVIGEDNKVNKQCIFDITIENAGDGLCYLSCIDDIQIQFTSEEQVTYRPLKEKEYSTFESGKLFIINKDYHNSIIKSGVLTLRFAIFYNDNDLFLENTAIDIYIPFIYQDKFELITYNARSLINLILKEKNHHIILEPGSIGILNESISNYKESKFFCSGKKSNKKITPGR